MLKNNVFGVLGLGKTGKSVVDFLYKKGMDIFAFDDHLEREDIKNFIKRYSSDVKFYSKSEALKVLDRVNTLVVSPGILSLHPIVEKARLEGIEIISEIELAYRYKENGYIIAITGTNGKTTTTSILENILKNDGKRAIAVGNIGRPFISLVDEDYEIFVIEVSSFQLETTYSFRPDMALFLNIGEDHLDRHGDVKRYFEIKKRMFKRQTDNDMAILNQEYPIIRELESTLLSRVFLFGEEKRYKNTYGYIEQDSIVITDNLRELRLFISKLKSTDRPFVYNVMAASLSAFLLGVSDEAIEKGAYSFIPLPHRMEIVDVIDGVKFINDSKATNPDAVFWALSSFEKNVILIMGGQNKGLSFKGLKPVIDKKVKTLILMGDAKEHIARELSFSHTFFAKNMEDAVFMAYKMSDRGDIVLLSPGCTSWDMYKNYEDRGNDFKNCVKRLKEAKDESKRT